jgi:hypothetical protein
VFGALGTLLLFFESFAYETPPAYFNQGMVDGLRKRNKRSQQLQRAGLGLLIDKNKSISVTAICARIY